MCAATRAHLGPDLRCEAWQFPDLETRHGAIYFASTNAGSADVLVRRYPDGRVAGGSPGAITEDLWPSLIGDVRAGRLSPGVLMQLRLLVAGRQVTVSGPFAVIDGAKLTIEARLDGDELPDGTLPSHGPTHGRYRIELEADGGVSMQSL